MKSEKKCIQRNGKLWWRQQYSDFLRFSTENWRELRIKNLSFHLLNFLNFHLKTFYYLFPRNPCSITRMMSSEFEFFRNLISCQLRLEKLETSKRLLKSTESNWTLFLRVTSFYCLPTCLTLTQKFHEEISWVLLRIFLRHRQLCSTIVDFHDFGPLPRNWIRGEIFLNSQFVRREKRLTGVISSSECKEMKKVRLMRWQRVKKCWYEWWWDGRSEGTSPRAPRNRKRICRRITTM